MLSHSFIYTCITWHDQKLHDMHTRAMQAGCFSWYSLRDDTMCLTRAAPFLTLSLHICITLFLSIARTHSAKEENTSILKLTAIAIAGIITAHNLYTPRTIVADVIHKKRHILA